MRVFVISLLAFALLVGIIVGNCFYVSITTDNIKQALLQLPKVTEADSALTQLETYWQMRRTEISFSVSFNEIRDMDNCLIQLRTACACADDYEFELARALALKSAERMRRLERFSWECII